MNLGGVAHAASESNSHNDAATAAVESASAHVNADESASSSPDAPTEATTPESVLSQEVEATVAV